MRRRHKPLGWPAYMAGKRLSQGCVAYYWQAPTWARKRGCPLSSEALGSDFSKAKARCDDLLNPQFLAFVEGMKALSETTLEAFQEEMLGTTIHVFGGVAVAVVACEVTENQKDVSRTVEMMLLVKQDDVWRIAAQASSPLSNSVTRCPKSSSMPAVAARTS